MGQACSTPCFSFLNHTKPSQNSNKSLECPEQTPLAQTTEPATSSNNLSHEGACQHEAALPAGESLNSIVPAVKPHVKKDAPVDAVAAALVATGEGTDVSPKQNGSLMKYVIKAGPADGVTPSDGVVVEMAIRWRLLPTDKDAYPDPRSEWNNVTNQRLKFALGDCERCDAIESLLSSMRHGESAVCRCTGDDNLVRTDESLGVSPGQFEGVDFCIELEYCERKDVMEMPAEDRVTYMVGRKEAAAKYFKNGRILSAYHKYRMVQDVLEYTKDIKNGKLLDEAKEVRRTAALNEAACCLKLGDPKGAIKASSKVLKEQPQNEKALFRRGSAYFKVGDYVQAASDLKRCVEINPGNQEARKLYSQCRSDIKQTGEAQKGLYAKMMTTGAKAEEEAAKSAATNRQKEAEKNIKDLEIAQEKLQKGLETQNKKLIADQFVVLEELIGKAKVKYVDVQRRKIGKDVGSAMREHPELVQPAGQIIRAIQQLAKQTDQGVS